MSPPAGFSERRFTSQDGLSLYYRDYGNANCTAVPVLCLSGISRNSKDFHALALRLAGGSAGRRVICPDYRGRGRSDYDAEWSRYTPPTYLNDIRHLLALTGAHKVVVIGTSLGGLLAAGMTAAMPTSIVGVVLNDIGPDLGTTALARIISYIGDDSPEADWRAVVGRMKRYFPNLNAGTDEDWMLIAKASYRQCADGLIRNDWDPAIARPLSGTGLPDLWPLFRAFGRLGRLGHLGRRRVLVLRGETSDILSSATLDAMSREITGLSAVTVPGIGHAPTLMEKESLAAIDELLAGF